MDVYSDALRHALDHILSERTKYLACLLSTNKIPPPLFVGVQGPQGSGKTFLSSGLHSALTKEHKLQVAVLSIDDLYLPHEDLVKIAQDHPDNKLLQGRGQPGTHDLELGKTLMSALKEVNSLNAKEVKIPAFDKSLFDGSGDRVPESQWKAINGPVDIVILEGWFVGFSLCSERELEDRYIKGAPLPTEIFDLHDFCTRKNISEINQKLVDYVELWSMLDAFIQLSPVDGITNVYAWRLDQEHHMKAQNGGRGMTDQQVKQFVDRYIPGYVFFSDGVVRGSLSAVDSDRKPPSWIGKSLRLMLGAQREVVNVEKF